MLSAGKIEAVTAGGDARGFRMISNDFRRRSGTALKLIFLHLRSVISNLLPNSDPRSDMGSLPAITFSSCCLCLHPSAGVLHLYPSPLFLHPLPVCSLSFLLYLSCMLRLSKGREKKKESVGLSGAWKGSGKQRRRRGEEEQATNNALWTS